MSRVLVVDDEKNICLIVSAMLKEEGHDAQSVNSTEEALEVLATESFDLVVTDLALPGQSGLDLLKQIKETHKDTQVVMMTAYATVKTAVEAMRLGAFHYVTKPFDNEEFLLTVGNALKMSHLTHKVTHLENSLKERYHFKSLLGDSSSWSAVLDLLDRLASVDGPVLVTGESGTGKEMVARSLHFASPRADKHFEAVNCGAVPFNLMESTFFGHMKGAFTGADKNHIGAFERCDGGTLFLDEVSELPMESQVKLLRVLQEGEITPVGSDKVKKVNVRIFAACNKDLETEISEGNFRQDFYYRLSVLLVELPPLRERRGDVSLLCDFFLEKHASKEDISVQGYSAEVRKALEQYPWPGNIRELENAVYRMMVLAQGRRVELADLPNRIKNAQETDFSLPSGSDMSSIVEDATGKIEKKLISERLAMFEGNKTQTAESLGVSRKTLFNKMKLYGIQ
jgi:DNA-binding NtrC family response regulator